MRAGFTSWDQLDDSIRAEIAVTEDDFSAMRAAKVVSGHFALGSLLRLTQPESIVTVLREPRTRLLSHFAFLRVHTPEQRQPRPFMVFESADGTLDEFLGDPAIAASTDNVVCRMLLHDTGVISEAEFIPPTETSEIARSALKRLDEFGVVCVLERQQQMWADLSKFFGVPLEPQREQVTGVAVSLRRSLAPIVIDRGTLELLEKRVAADSIVYEEILVRRGASKGEVQPLRDAAFADQLVRLGDALGRSAAQAGGLRADLDRSKEALTAATGELERLVETLRIRSEELTRRSETLASAEHRYQQTRAELQRTLEALEWHRERLAGIERSRTWRMTAGLRRAKRSLTGAVRGPE